MIKTRETATPILCALCLMWGTASAVLGGPLKPFVRGGQFKDLILSVPIHNGLESEGIWGNPNVVPRDKDSGIEDNEWCYWGGNPVKGKDGKYHMAICRWPENTGHGGWFESEVAHCVSETPTGPYKITRTIVKKGHNPEVMVMPDGTYALHVMDASVYVADQMPGPWKRIGHMRLDSRGLRSSDRLGSNLTTEFRPDGSIILMKKNGDVAISRAGILGPYKMVSIENYSRSTGYPEDPVIWRSRHQYHVIYNHAQDRKSAYMRSLDGIHWKVEEGLPYDVSTTFYTDGTKNQWYKFERPKVLQDDLGRATHLALAVMDVAKGADKGNDNHSSKNIVLPLVVEKLVSIVGDQPITESTRKIRLRIEAEAGFNPVQDVNVTSLRFGSDSVVNHGGGCKAVSTHRQGADLLVDFEGDTGLRDTDFDFKLIGETKRRELIVGFALLPDRSPRAAALITLPVKVNDADGQRVLQSAVENWGLEESGPIQIGVYQLTREGAERLQTVAVPPVAPYGSAKISVKLGPAPAGPVEYELVISEKSRRVPRWLRADDTSGAVSYGGEWELREAAAECFLHTEHSTTNLGASVTYTFTGNRAMARGKIGRGMGTFAVFVDGDFIETIRCNWGQVLGAPLYRTGLLEEGRHTLKLVKSEGEYNGEVTIDAFAHQSAADGLAKRQ